MQTATFYKLLIDGMALSSSIHYQVPKMVPPGAGNPYIHYLGITFS